MRLNLGCGGRKMAGWINVDKYPTCGPDQVVDLEQFPWPWPDNSVDEISMHHVLEHLGAETEVYLGIIKEMYRVCRDNAKIEIVVPHPRHDDFIGDPTHVRAVTKASMTLLSQSANRYWLANGYSNTPLALYIGVDFATESATHDLASPWSEAFLQKTMSDAELDQAARSFNNVIKQIRLILRPIKPAGRTCLAQADLQAPPLVPDHQAKANAKPDSLSAADILNVDA